MANYTCMYIKSQTRIKMRMEIIIGLCGKENEVISWCLLYVGSCLVLSGNCHCMHYHCQGMLHQIWTCRINNDNIHPSSKIVFDDDNIHSSSCVAGEKVRNLFLYMGSTFRCISCKGILKCIMGYSAFTSAWAT
jgi:hypothetical protein